MTGFNDARCPTCGKHIGWVGRLADRPPCPQCGRNENKMRPSKEQQRIAGINAGILLNLSDVLTPSERLFIKNMSEHVDFFTAVQVKNINRIYQKVVG